MEYIITGTICLFIGVIIGVGVMGLVAGGRRDETESVPETVITPEVGEVFRKWDERWSESFKGKADEGKADEEYREFIEGVIKESKEHVDKVCSGIKCDEQALEGVCQSGYKKTWVHRDIE